MRFPSIERDGWQLDDGEAYHADAPKTFWIPSEYDRSNLRAGDFAKLIFRVEFAEEPTVERMWVIVRAALGEATYLGILDNEPTSLEENDRLWVGFELPFQARHVIAIERADAASITLANQGPMKNWR